MGVLLPAVSQVAGCAHGGVPTLADARVAFAVRTALVNDPAVGVAPVDVAVDDGVVTLTGRVATDDSRRRIVEIAGQVPGVRRVESRLAVGPRPAGLPPEPAPGRLSALTSEDVVAPPRRFGVGGVFTVPFSQTATLDGLPAVGPVFRFGRGGGWHPVVTLTRVRDDLPAAPGTDAFGELRLLTLGGGLGYGMVLGRRWSLSAGATAGWSFNHIRLEPGPTVPGGVVLPVAVSNSPAATAGASLWFEATRRVSIGVTGAYLWTRPDATWLDGDRFLTRGLDADAVLLGVSAAWWVF